MKWREEGRNRAEGKYAKGTKEIGWMDVWVGGWVEQELRERNWRRRYVLVSIFLAYHTITGLIMCDHTTRT